MNKMDISVVIPLYNEDESIPELYAWIARVMKEHHFTYEVIFINDGSTDRSWEIISELHKQQPEVVKGSVVTMARVRPSIAVSNRHRVMW